VQYLKAFSSRPFITGNDSRARDVYFREKANAGTYVVKDDLKLGWVYPSLPRREILVTKKRFRTIPDLYAMRGSYSCHIGM
jgi:hypothetical protein